MTLSADGHHLVLAGYDAPPCGSLSLAGTAGTAVGRTVGRVDASGAIDTNTVLSDFASGNNPRGVASDNGASFYVDGGTDGIRYATLGAPTSTQLSTTLTNLRADEIPTGSCTSVRNPVPSVSPPSARVNQSRPARRSPT